MTRKELLRFIFWEWIEPLGSALCIALLVMKFVVALYVIPTGSMQPTLHGAGDYGMGDKVLVNKFIYRFEEPQRWDVIVFDYPFRTIHCFRCEQDVYRRFPKDEEKVIQDDLKCTNPQTDCWSQPKDLGFVDKEYIKRCTAVPGDEISIRDGNVVLRKKDGGWEPSIKTPEAQGELWIDIFNSDEPEVRYIQQRLWHSLNNPSFQNKWSEKGPVVLEGGKDSVLLFKEKKQSSKLLVGYGDQGHRLGKAPLDAPLVGDVLLDLELASYPNEGMLVLEIERNGVPHKMRVDFAKKTWFVELGEKVLGEGNLPSDRRFQFCRLDGRLEVNLDGNQKSFDFNEGELDQTVQIRPKIRWSGEGKLGLSHIRVARDIFYDLKGDYFSGEERSYVVRPGEYFAMGDNSYHSSDSRDWGPVPEEEMIGKALVVLLPFSRMKFIR